MDKADDNEQLEIPALGYVLANVAHTERLMQPDTNHPALYGRFLRDSVGLICVWGGISESVFSSMKIFQTSEFLPILREMRPELQDYITRETFEVASRNLQKMFHGS